MSPDPRFQTDGPQRIECMELCGGRAEGVRFYRRPGLDVWVASRTKQNTTAGGGDLYLISSCASGRITRMLMADVCGFGPLFEAMTARFREVMKRNANTIKQARSVREISRQLAESARNGGYASTLMTTYFAPTRSLTLCNAGQPPPLLFRRDRREWTVLKHVRRGTAIPEETPGVVAADEYQHHQTKLETDDLVLAFSNSLTETQSHNGHTMGLNTLLNRVQQLEWKSPGEIPERLLEALSQEQAGNLEDADATLVLCHATKTPVDWRDSVLAPFRLLRSVTDRTSIE